MQTAFSNNKVTATNPGLTANDRYDCSFQVNARFNTGHSGPYVIDCLTITDKERPGEYVTLSFCQHNKKLVEIMFVDGKRYASYKKFDDDPQSQKAVHRQRCLDPKFYDHHEIRFDYHGCIAHEVYTRGLELDYCPMPDEQKLMNMLKDGVASHVPLGKAQANAKKELMNYLDANIHPKISCGTALELKI